MPQLIESTRLGVEMLTSEVPLSSGLWALISGIRWQYKSLLEFIEDMFNLSASSLEFWTRCDKTTVGDIDDWRQMQKTGKNCTGRKKQRIYGQDTSSARDMNKCSSYDIEGKVVTVYC